MKQADNTFVRRVIDRLPESAVAGARRGRARLTGGRDYPELLRRVEELESAVQENRRLNQRLADVIDVVTEVIVPAADRDDDRMKAALDRLNQVL